MQQQNCNLAEKAVKQQHSCMRIKCMVVAEQCEGGQQLSGQHAQHLKDLQRVHRSTASRPGTPPST
jgi:hypothetical protein